MGFIRYINLWIKFRWLNGQFFIKNFSWQQLWFEIEKTTKNDSDTHEVFVTIKVLTKLHTFDLRW